MVRHHRLAWMAASLLAAAACGEGGGGGQGADGGSGGDAGLPDGGTPGFETLVTGDWELEPGSEAYFCARETVEEDLFIDGFEAIAPFGTHHTVVTVGDPSAPDGVVRCNTATNHEAMIFGSGVGTNPIEFPDGIAMRIEAGQQVLVNLHVFNATDETISGTSGTRIRPVDPADVEHEAEAVLMGKVFTLSVPPGESTHVGRCNMNADVTLFAVGPHMHQLGTHMKVVAESSIDGEKTLFDEDYNFDNQILRLVQPEVAMKQGDTVEVHCTYENTTGQTVTWGESTNDEMCFGTVYRYPATASNIICAAD